ncbi:CdiA family toxin C-terminal domain-containing protein [Psychrobacter sp. T6-5]|uniref:CdiA family toxin C-terminal domain-containing protein n=1 Tax=Psychrobacter sp. T6-5 TaxID=3457451 RepID=UPI003FD4BF75
MFDDSGYYNENSIYGTYGGSYQGNRNNQKDFNKVAKNINSQMSDISTRDDRIEPLYPEQYYIPLSELKAIRAAGISAAKLVAQKEEREQLLNNLRNMSVDNNLKYHLANADGFTRAKGISGGHNRANFEAELKKHGGRVVSETPTGVNGIVTVKYEIPGYDRAGNRDGWKKVSSPKTVYDPAKFSDSEILDMGLEAATNGYREAITLNKRQYDGVVNGVSFQIYINPKTGVISNVHPQ